MIIVDENEQPLLIISNVLKNMIEEHPALLGLYADYEWARIGTAWELVERKEKRLLTMAG